MNSDLQAKLIEADPFSETRSIVQLRRELTALLGPESVARAHTQRHWLDATLLFGLLSAFGLNFFVIDLGKLSLPFLLGISLFQGWLLLAMPLLSHDLFEHRHAWKGIAQDWLSALLFLPSTTPASVHRVGHYRHHAKLGTPEDTEASLGSVNTTLRRLLFSTAIGYLLARSGHWNRSHFAGYEAFIGATERDHVLKRREILMLIGWLSLMLALSILGHWEAILFGYWLPICVVAPVLVTIRIIIEHANLDPRNPWWIATYYQCGPVTRILFLADCGDCHYIHHVFPGVAWYNVPRLVREAHPHLMSKGIIPTGSLPSLIWDWFFLNHAHRSLWTDNLKQRDGEEGSHRPH